MLESGWLAPHHHIPNTCTSFLPFTSLQIRSNYHKSVKSLPHPVPSYRNLKWNRTLRFAFPRVSYFQKSSKVSNVCLLTNAHVRRCNFSGLEIAEHVESILSRAPERETEESAETTNQNTLQTPRATENASRVRW